ncbi:Response regulator receiver domain-containing protein [Desulfomicrobium apsheronum]|uniref:Response regulator receiver domain-containing protein n=1 Tax=Desulfomicrobium apsheronum TaxID=52560 RepID=A0A1I3XSX2_9BACT|nr:response regulator [Desulfomicrobium apsheronum]SFK22161.1 Response regulator receiver domain-containing protein [Desulfomicrobium apsheronum]
MTDSILLVDDETQFLATMAKRLRKRGFLVRTAGSGLEGLRALQTEPADVVVLDVGMPDMDGIQVLREIKLRFPQVQVLMLTGHADMEVAISGMAMGAFDYLMKPVELDVLIGKIREACSRSRKAGERRGLE